MTQAAVFISTIRKERRTVEARHTPRIPSDVVRVHVSTGAELYAVTRRYDPARVYLCRGWGRIAEISALLRALVAATDAIIVDEWGKPVKQFAPKPITLPLLTTSAVREALHPNQTAGSPA